MSQQKYPTLVEEQQEEIERLEAALAAAKEQMRSMVTVEDICSFIKEAWCGGNNPRLYVRMMLDYIRQKNTGILAWKRQQGEG